MITVELYKVYQIKSHITSLIYTKQRIFNLHLTTYISNYYEYNDDEYFDYHGEYNDDEYFDYHGEYNDDEYFDYHGEYNYDEYFD
jgi:hypothetical protein